VPVVVWTYLSFGDDAEIHRCLHLLVPRGLERLVLVTNHTAESFNILRGNDDLGAVGNLPNTDRWEGLVVTESETPVEAVPRSVLDLDCLEVPFPSPIGADGAENPDTGGGTLEMNDNFLTIAGREETTDCIVNV